MHCGENIRANRRLGYEFSKTENNYKFWWINIVTIYNRDLIYRTNLLNAAFFFFYYHKIGSYLIRIKINSNERKELKYEKGCYEEAKLAIF